MPKKQASKNTSARLKKVAWSRERAQAISVPDTCDICIIGGGAAGLVAAFSAAEAGASVVVLDAKLRMGRKLLATGNGKCNLSNQALGHDDWENHYNCPNFVKASVSTQPLKKITDLFRECGLLLTTDTLGGIWPAARQASCVLNVLLTRAKRSGALLAPGRIVEAIDPQDAQGYFHVKYRFDEGDTRMQTLACKSIIAATGGESSHLWKRLGIATIPTRPGLLPLATQPNPNPEMDGRRNVCHVKLMRNNVCLAEETGEVLFRKYGLSGICIFNLSLLAQKDDMVLIDFVPEYEEAEILHSLSVMAGENKDNLIRALDGILDPRIGRTLMAEAITLQEQESSQDVLHIATQLVKCYSYTIEDTADSEHAMVSMGGIATDQIDPTSLETRTCKNFFACGEACDVHGVCGGWNLSWAWLSAQVAARSAAKSVNACQDTPHHLYQG